MELLTARAVVRQLQQLNLQLVVVGRRRRNHSAAIPPARDVAELLERVANDPAALRLLLEQLLRKRGAA